MATTKASNATISGNGRGSGACALKVIRSPSRGLEWLRQCCSRALAALVGAAPGVT